MATAMNHELDTLRKRKSAIIDSVANQATPRWLSVKLQEEGMISAENASAIINSSSLSNEDKVDRLIQAVESKLRHGSAPAQHFQEFVEILQSEPALNDLAQKLQTEYYLRRISKSEEDEPENDDTEESKLMHIEERRRDLHGHQRPQTEQEWRSHQPRESRSAQPRRDNRCIVLTFCYGCSLIAVMILIFLINGFDFHLRLNRDTEQQITKSSVPYGISMRTKLYIEQELVLWLSCFIICVPWIHIQCIPKPLVAGFCFLLMVGILFLLKDFECFKVSDLLLPAKLSLGLVMTSITSALPNIMCHQFKHCNPRVFVTLLVTMLMMVFWLLFTDSITAFRPDTQEVQESKLQEFIAFILMMCLIEAIFTNCANILPIHHDRTMYESSLCMSILGVVITLLHFIALLLTASLDGAALITVLLLLTSLVLVTATIFVKCVPSQRSRSFKLWVFCWNIDINLFKEQVVYYGIIVGVRNLLMEFLVVWKHW